MPVKTCAICGESFEARAVTTRYCSANCRREANRKRQRELYQANPERFKEAQARYAAKHPERRKQQIKKGNRKRRDKVRAWDLRKKYGIEPEDYDAMLEAQKGRCAICGGDNGGRRLHVDHDEGSGLVRELLCQRCNMAIGLLGHNPERVTAASQYLTTWSGLHRYYLKKKKEQER